MTVTSPDDMFGLNVECFEGFFQTMYERQLIWKRRFIDKKESPWTTDAIFKNSSSPMCTVNLTEILNTASIR